MYFVLITDITESMILKIQFPAKLSQSLSLPRKKTAHNLMS